MFQPDEGLIHLKDLRGKYIFTEEERITCSIAKLFEGNSKRGINNGYMNINNFDIGHIGKVDTRYLGNFGEKDPSEVQPGLRNSNPFTEFIQRGLEAHIKSKKWSTELLFVSKLDVERSLNTWKYLLRNQGRNNLMMVSSYNMPLNLHASKFNSVTLQKFIFYLKELFSSDPEAAQRVIFKISIHE